MIIIFFFHHFCVGCKIFTLSSVNTFRKYMFIFDLLPSLLFSSNWFILKFSDYKLVQLAMAQHKSQMVWFRRLYVLFSRYMLINTLHEMNISDVELEMQILNASKDAWTRWRRMHEWTLTHIWYFGIGDAKVIDMNCSIVLYIFFQPCISGTKWRKRSSNIFFVRFWFLDMLVSCWLLKRIVQWVRLFRAIDIWVIL